MGESASNTVGKRKEGREGGREGGRTGKDVPFSEK